MPSDSSLAQPLSNARPNRARQWHHKVKTGNDPVRLLVCHSSPPLGCLTCKTRRVKCTEEKPCCSKCLSAGRKCYYEAPPQDRIFNPSYLYLTHLSDNTLDLVKPKTYGTSDPEEVRALQYFLEVTVPAATTYNSHTRDFFANLIPQVAQSEAAVRHLAVAVATRQESMASSSEQALALSRVQSKHYVAGLKALSQGKASSEEVMLLSSALLLILGQMEPPEEQTAQSMFHLMAAIRILTERLNSEDSKQSTIIESYIHPIFARLESMMSIFMMPENGTDAVLCTVEPEEPILPDQFSDLEEAREAWVSICCWRYRKKARSQPWTSESPCFEELRGLLLKFNNLLIAYAGRAALGSPHELRRAMAMISQFRMLFLAMMFSVRHDLHIPDQVRPTFVNLIHPGEVSVTFHLPKRTMAMIPDLDWERSEKNDPLKVRLWPVVDTVKRSENVGLQRVSFRM